ncbi:hypothetical protein D3C80_754810 [compost metagenome]
MVRVDPTGTPPKVEMVAISRVVAVPPPVTHDATPLVAVGVAKLSFAPADSTTTPPESAVTVY